MSPPDDNVKPESEAPAQTPPQLSIQKIYTKDVSFETPNSPHSFRTEWKPDMDIQLQNEATHLENDLYEIVVRVTVTVKLDGQAAFLAEVNQAGIFSASGYSQEQMGHLLGSYCPGVLYPYARELVSDLITRGGFPQLLLAPVNFDALYARHLQEKQAGGDSQGEAVH
jgi:preprotein translocase subunit SecB